jgi:hypothetical protein
VLNAFETFTIPLKEIDPASLTQFLPPFEHDIERVPIAHVLEYNKVIWPAPGSEDTELGVLMELEVGHGETEVYARVQA